MGTPGGISVFTRSQEHPESSGWMVRLKANDPAFRATSRPDRFGRIMHIIKKGGASVQLHQGVSSENKTVFTELSPEQRLILKVLAEIGIVTKITG